MSDIVERLRKLTASGRAKHLSKADRLEAAGTIAALRAGLHDMTMVADHHSAQSMYWAAEAEKLARNVEELKAENERLRAALHRIDHLDPSSFLDVVDPVVEKMGEVARSRAGLKGEVK